MARNDHQRVLLSIPTTYFICVIALPALWTIVTQAIYNVQESNNFPRTKAPYFTSIEKSPTSRIPATSVDVATTEAHIELRAKRITVFVLVLDSILLNK